MKHLKQIWGIRHIRWLWLSYQLQRHVTRCKEHNLGWFAQQSDIAYLTRVWYGED